MIQSGDDDAVSPTITTVLMVAVTVTLAAFVASFSLGALWDIPENGLVGAKAVRTDGGAIQVTYLGGDGSSQVVLDASV